MQKQTEEEDDTHILKALDDLALVHVPDEEAIFGSAASQAVKVTWRP
jgi:hypothetical protein